MKRVALLHALLRPARRWAGVAAVAATAFGGAAFAHHPDKENMPVHQRIDVIGPVGNRLPPGHRRVYNRPTYIGGKIAYWIAPSSQEAMAWHRAEHSGAYEPPKKCLRLEQHYFYPKPWEVLQVGPRRSVLEPPQEDRFELDELVEDPALQVMPPSEPAVAPDMFELENGEPTLELPSLETPSLESPSDVPQPPPSSPGAEPVLEPPVDGADVKGADVKIDPEAGAFIFRRGGVLRAMGMEAPAAVSQRPVSQEEPDLETAEKPVFLRRWLHR